MNAVYVKLLVMTDWSFIDLFVIQKFLWALLANQKFVVASNLLSPKGKDCVTGLVLCPHIVSRAIFYSLPQLQTWTWIAG